MPGFQDAAQVILQILRDPAWSGVAGICALISIPVAFLIARQQKSRRSQEPQNLPILPGKSRYFIRGRYRKATLAKEFMNDLDILVVVDPKKLAS
jgi:ABC-type spermidine/putrescine transport system permease subunit I